LILGQQFWSHVGQFQQVLPSQGVRSTVAISFVRSLSSGDCSPIRRGIVKGTGIALSIVRYVSSDTSSVVHGGKPRLSDTKLETLILPRAKAQPNRKEPIELGTQAPSCTAGGTRRRPAKTKLSGPWRLYDDAYKFPDRPGSCCLGFGLATERRRWLGPQAHPMDGPAGGSCIRTEDHTRG
jgi:hypothetical protein